MLANLKRCAKCVVCETQDAIRFDNEGVCNVCKQIEYKHTKIDWNQRKRELIELLNNYKGKAEYDCIIPFSGGKDSTYTVYSLVKDFGVKPLVVSFDHGLFRPRTLENNERTLKKLGVDFLKFRANWRIVKKLMLESLVRKGDFCWHCHVGCLTYPMKVAVKYKIPLVIWGQPTAEYGSYYSYEEKEEVNEEYVNRFVNLGITAEDMVGMLDDSVSLRDLEPFRYPSFKELKAIKCRSIQFGNYVPWDTKKHAKIINQELGWQFDEVEGIPEEGYGYEKVECMLTGVRDYLKFIKRGFGRTTHLTSIDIREGKMLRDEALKLVEKYDGKRPPSLDYFLDLVGISEDEFMKIAMKQSVSPYVHNPKKVERFKELWDRKLWNRTPIPD
jgi:N-acetyl sugar amidotransferase